MCDYPIHTKLSDLISDDESDETDIKQRVNVNFAESSSRTIDYKLSLNNQAKSKSLITVPATSLLHTTDGKTCYDLTCDNCDKDSPDVKDSVNSNSKKKGCNSKSNKSEVQDKEQSAKHKAKNVLELSKSKANKALNESKNIPVHELNENQYSGVSEDCNSSSKSGEGLDKHQSPKNKARDVLELSKSKLNKILEENSNTSEEIRSSKVALDSESNKEIISESQITNQSEDKNEELNDSEQLDNNMSKRFGLLFQKGVRTTSRTDRGPKSSQKSAEEDQESVLPHLKSASQKDDFAESSFIEVKADHYSTRAKKASLETPAPQSASTSTSDDSELGTMGTRADPIGESCCDVNMADDEVAEGNHGNKDKKTHDGEIMPDEVDKNTDNGASKTSTQNGDISAESKEVQSPSKDGDDKEQVVREKPASRSRSDTSNNTTIERDSESDSNDQNETKADSTEDKMKTITKPSGKKELIGARTTRSSLSRRKNSTNSDSNTKKFNRAESISSDDSDRMNRQIQPPPAQDPVPEVDSDFKPYEHWQGLKESQKVDVKNKVVAKKEFSEKYHKHGLPKRAPTFFDSETPKHHASTMSLSSTATKDTTVKKFLKPEFNPFASPNDKYLTPLQQKEKMIHDLQKYVTKLEETINLQADEIANFQEDKEEALQDLASEKDAEMDEIFQEVKKLEIEKDEIIEQLQKTEEALEVEKEMVANLQGKIAKMEIDTEEREEMHNRNYFQMYQKGREAQLIEQEEDIVCHTLKNPGNAPNKQLATRLEKTEKQLDKLRQTFRNDTYNKGPQIGSDSEAQVELLKSAVFYYLTDTQPDINLRTMLSMLNYSEVQRKNIYRHLTKKKN